MTDTKSRILAAASELFLEGGSQALSVRAIAQRAGLSTIGIYSHFQGKQGILDALYVEAFGYVTEAMEPPPEPITPREAVLRAARRYLESAERHEAHYRLIFGEGDGSYEPSPEAQEAGARAFQRLEKLAGLLLPDDAPREACQDAAVQIWAFIHGSISLRHHGVAQLVRMDTFGARTMQGTEYLVDALLAAHGAKT